jgi:hypothetical protein
MIFRDFALRFVVERGKKRNTMQFMSPGAKEMMKW